MAPGLTKEERDGGAMAVAAATSGVISDKVGFWRRTGAYLIDAIALAIITSIIGGILFPAPAGVPDDLTAAYQRSSSFNLLVNAVYFVGLWVYWNGQTLGMKVLGIKVVKTDGSALTISTGIIRFIGLIISFLCLLIGVIWVAFDANKQGWHDKMAGTYVVKA